MRAPLDCIGSGFFNKTVGFIHPAQSGQPVYPADERHHDEDDCNDGKDEQDKPSAALIQTHVQGDNPDQTEQEGS